LPRSKPCLPRRSCRWSRFRKGERSCNRRCARLRLQSPCRPLPGDKAARRHSRFRRSQLPWTAPGTSCSRPRIRRRSRTPYNSDWLSRHPGADLRRRWMTESRTTARCKPRQHSNRRRGRNSHPRERKSLRRGPMKDRRKCIRPVPSRAPVWELGIGS
jgi:hypothetical protein